VKSPRSKFLSLVLAAATLLCFLASCAPQTNGSIIPVDEIRTLEHDGRERTYLLYVPYGSSSFTAEAVMAVVWPA